MQQFNRFISKRKEMKCCYKRLGESCEEFRERQACRKGCVPVLVGGEEEEIERFLVHAELLREPCMAKLLEMAAQELGYGQQGILRIPCSVQYFLQVVDAPRRASS